MASDHDTIRTALNEALGFVEMIERREDTHYLVGGHITDAIRALDRLEALRAQAGDSNAD